MAKWTELKVPITILQTAEGRFRIVETHQQDGKQGGVGAVAQPTTAGRTVTNAQLLAYTQQMERRQAEEVQ